ncbi:MAG TPA: glycosyltransferase N-terminal domain-containing protein [Longimicrobiales bacterium]
MLFREVIYDSVLRAVRPVVRLAAPLDGKLARGVAGWSGAAAALAAWAAESRDPARPLVWVHAPSVGEGLMAQAIVDALRRERPEVQVVFTHFSPSAERLVGRVGADAYGYLPWDVGREVGRVVAALKPAVIAFVRTEIWPGLVREAKGAGARLALVNAVLSAGSSRLGAVSRYFLGPAYGRLDAVGAVAAEDAGRFPLLGVPAERVRVTGDARFDQVWSRVSGLDRGSRLLERLRDPRVTTVVAGSTWPADEKRLVPAFARVRAGGPFRLIVAPHEPDEAHLEGLERRLDAAGLRHARLARVERESGELPEVVVIDRVGVLADVYAVGDVAYVGGGFHAAGLHSVVEPAALGVPVLFGPQHGNAREAGELAAAGGGAVVGDEATLAARLRELAADPDARRRMGEQAVQYVRSRLGGAARNAELIAELLDAAR